MITTAPRTCFLNLLLLCLLSLIAPLSGAQDLALLNLATPQSGCMLGNETVRVVAYNYGARLNAGTQFLGLYALDGNASQNQLFVLDTPWESMSARTLVFDVPGNFSNAGDHTLLVSINFASDPNNGNNTLHNLTIRSSAMSVAGTLTPSGNGSSGMLSLSGQIGSVLQWEQSPDGLRWYKLANGDTTQSYAGLDQPTQFRVRVGNEACPAVVSPATTVTP
ncbi:hypothetical protein C7S18_04705 [Ahniella affigens]|uniref:Spore coat protein U domain-containing protein n=1 Tax=Ahniella affigens TaxID=2021234 RepID=A0A2P1PNW7_9GAMM|nr:hypothetical protein [Ahniella affigens]AVP96541.1 hypothetical protein C7S18_04705 [Ahniella affigens]